MHWHNDSMNNFRIVLGIVVSSMLWPSAGFADAPPRSVTLTEEIGDWVVHEPSGRVFASLSEGNEVVEFDSNAQEVQRFKVGETPTEMIIKGDQLVVACTKSPALHVIDLSSNRVTGMAAVSGKGPNALFCSQVDNHYVYCVCNTGSAWWDGEVFQVDLQENRVRNRVKVQSWGQSHVVHVAMSRDGKWIVPDSRGATSPSGADLMKVDEEEATFTQVRDYHDSFGQMVAGPMNRYWTFGNALYTLDITKKVRSFGGTPVAIHPHLDLVAAFSSGGLLLERFSDASPIGTVSLPAATANAGNRSSRNSRRSNIDPTVQFDLKHNVVFVGTESHGTWIDLAPYSENIAPLKVVQAPSEVTTTVMKPLEIALPVTNADQEPAAKLRIAEGPETATLIDGKLSWTPRAQDVGFFNFRLEVVSTNDEKVLDSADMTVHVTLPKVDLEFQARAMEISENGQFLVVWGPVAGKDSRHPAQPGPDDVAVVNLKTLEIIARKSLPQGVRCATIDENYVYLAPNSGTLFYRLDHQLAGSERQFLQSAPKQLVKFAPNVVVAEGSKLQAFDTQKMQPVPLNSPQNFALIGENVIQIGSRVFDRQTGETLRITPTDGLPTLVRNEATGFYRLPDRNQSPVRWGRRLQGSSLSNSKGRQITSWPGGRIGVISERWPMGVLVASSQQGRIVNTTMELCDLVEGLVKHSAVIDVSSNGNSRGTFFNGANRLLVHEQTVLFLNNTELLVATIPTDVAEAMPVPVHFSQDQVTEIALSPSAVIPLRTAGLREGVTFSLLAESPGLTLDPKSGKLTVEVQRLWDDMTKRITSSGPILPGSRQEASFATRSNNAQKYEELTGKELPDDKFVAQIPILAALQDSEGQEDTVQFSVVVVGPRKEIDLALKKNEEAQAQQRARMEEARQKQREAAMNNPGIPQAKSTEQRLDELEARTRRMEATLDAILRRLEQQRP
ncbi:hypothetical protein [Bremerella cremea]|uniref:YncE family protein n=1 Tax=Bremerella cremea TaxID=1031537 RepID=UPI0031E838EC